MIDVGYYLSLVVLYIEEGVVVRQFDHVEGIFNSFMNDGQMEEPVGRGTKKKNTERLGLK